MLITTHNTRSFPKWFYLIVLLVTLIISSTFSGCSTADATSANEVGKVQEEPIPPMKQMAFLLDSTGSTISLFSETARAEFAKNIANYIPERPTEKNGGVDAVPGLSLRMYLVNTNANNYGTAIYIIEAIPSIPALSAKPEVSENPSDEELEGNIEAYSAWKKEVAAWEKSYDDSFTKAQNLSAQIIALDLSISDTGPASGIYSALCALLGTCSQGDVTLVLCSDLFDNTPRQGIVPKGMSGNVIMVVPSPDGDSAAAESRGKEFSDILESWGFSTANFYSQDMIPTAISSAFI